MKNYKHPKLQGDLIKELRKAIRSNGPISEEWKNCLSFDSAEEQIATTRDTKIYLWGGMSVHPCGETYQEGGVDGFEEDSGDEFCQCPLCKSLSDILRTTYLPAYLPLPQNVKSP